MTLLILLDGRRRRDKNCLATDLQTAENTIQEEENHFLTNRKNQQPITTPKN